MTPKLAKKDADGAIVGRLPYLNMLRMVSLMERLGWYVARIRYILLTIVGRFLSQSSDVTSAIFREIPFFDSAISGETCGSYAHLKYANREAPGELFRAQAESKNS